MASVSPADAQPGGECCGDVIGFVLGEKPIVGRRFGQGGMRGRGGHGVVGAGVQHDAVLAGGDGLDDRAARRQRLRAKVAGVDVFRVQQRTKPFGVGADRAHVGYGLTGAGEGDRSAALRPPGRDDPLLRLSSWRRRQRLMTRAGGVCFILGEKAAVSVVAAPAAHGDDDRTRDGEIFPASAEPTWLAAAIAALMTSA